MNYEGPLFMVSDIRCFYQLHELLSLNLAYIACVSMATRVEVWRRQQIYTIYILWDHVSNHSLCVWLLNRFHLGLMRSHLNVINLATHCIQFQKGVFQNSSQSTLTNFLKSLSFISSRFHLKHKLLFYYKIHANPIVILRFATIMSALWFVLFTESGLSEFCKAPLQLHSNPIYYLWPDN